MSAAPPLPTPSLRDLQLLIWKLLVAPEGATEGLDGLVAAGELTREDLERWIAGDAKRTALGRIDVYASMYFFRLKEALLADFPKVARVLGAPAWHDLVTAYVLEHPSLHWSLRYIGERLSGFIRGTELARKRPWLADLAALEFTRSDVFQMEDLPILTREELAAVPPERFAELVFRPTRAFGLVPVSYDLTALFDVLEADEEAREEAGKVGEEDEGLQVADPRPAAGTLLVFRTRGHEVRHLPLSAEAEQALRGCFAGKSFGAVCETLAADGDLPAAAARASALLTDWLRFGLLSSYSLATTA